MYYIELHLQTASRKLKVIPRPVKVKVHSRTGPKKKKINVKLTTHSSSADLKKARRYTSTPYVFKVRYLFKHRDTFTLLFLLSPRFSKWLLFCMFIFLHRESRQQNAAMAKDTKNIRTSLKGVALKYNPQDLSVRQGFRAPVAASVRSRVKHNGTTSF